MKIAKYIGAPLMLFVCMDAVAQDLTKEITVEKDIVPIEREASRIDRLPQLRLPAVAMKRLSWSDRAVAAPVTASISTLAPAAYLSDMPRPEYRGYVYAGYFPALQADISAGYRFLSIMTILLRGRGCSITEASINERTLSTTSCNTVTTRRKSAPM